MKAIVCELCGSNDIIKQDSFFVCQHCGTKYSPEEARKLLVTVDNSEAVEKLRKLAQQAKRENNASAGEEYYSKLLQENPDDWEAQFYTAYFHTLNDKIANTVANASAFTSRTKHVLEEVANEPDPEKRAAIVKEIVEKTTILEAAVFNAAEKGVSVYSSDWLVREKTALAILFEVADTLATVYQDETGAYQLYETARLQCKNHPLELSGERLEAIQRQSAVMEAKARREAPSAAPAPARETQGAAPEKRETKENKTKKRSPLVPIVSLIIVAVICVLGFFGYNKYSEHREKEIAAQLIGTIWRYGTADYTPSSPTVSHSIDAREVYYLIFNDDQTATAIKTHREEVKYKKPPYESLGNNGTLHVVQGSSQEEGPWSITGISKGRATLVISPTAGHHFGEDKIVELDLESFTLLEHYRTNGEYVYTFKPVSDYEILETINDWYE